MKPQDWLPAPPPELPLPRFLVRKEKTTRLLPQTQLTREDVRVELWAERDRLHIGIQDKKTGEYIVSWWDEEASAMFDQGFFYDPGPLGWRIPAEKRRFEGSVLAYAEKMGLLSTGTPGAIEYYFLLSNNEVVSVKAANSTEARKKIEHELSHRGWSVSVVKEIPPPALSPQTQPKTDIEYRGYTIREWTEHRGPYTLYRASLFAPDGTFLGFWESDTCYADACAEAKAEVDRRLQTKGEALSPQTQPFAPPGVDSELESLVEAKRREWEGKGYPPGLIARALTMAREWPASMFASRLYQAVRGTPAERETQRQLYRMGLDVAQRWIEAMHRS